MTDSNKVLSLPELERIQYEKNFIKTAVCELRFPTLLKYEKEPPVQLQNEIRKEYPIYEAEQSLNVSVGGMGKENRYIFRSRKKDWVVSFKTNSISLETSSYINFTDFLKRLERLLDKSQKLLDTDFFTRIGLRYINEIPIEDGDINGWLNADLIAPLAKGVYGTVQDFLQQVRGQTTNGNHYNFRHGAAGVNEKGLPVYNLDFDFYGEDVPSDSVISLISDFNLQAFRFFGWAVGQKTVERMGKITPQET